MAIIRPTIMDIELHQDDRGSVYCALDGMDVFKIKRTYVVESHNKGMVRAWHGHKKAETYVHVIDGVVKLAAMDMGNLKDVTVATLSARKPQIFYVPAGYYNGAYSLTDNTKILVYSTLSFHEVVNDNERAFWTINKEIWRVDNR